ncbi:hypothetical protein [Qingrenia yutianensis]|nr:hypothetical protein [Qingrenia yutianensis]
MIFSTVFFIIGMIVSLFLSCAAVIVISLLLCAVLFLIFSWERRF